MKIQTFKNMKGLVYGANPKRIECDREGVLKIGGTEISVSSAEEVMPLLFNGCSGDYNATFTDSEGKTFELGTVTVKGGRIIPPPATSVELMELRCRMEAAEDAIHMLSNIFDTNSLNFIIK